MPSSLEDNLYFKLQLKKALGHRLIKYGHTRDISITALESASVTLATSHLESERRHLAPAWLVSAVWLTELVSVVVLQKSDNLTELVAVIFSCSTGIDDPTSLKYAAAVWLSVLPVLP